MDVLGAGHHWITKHREVRDGGLDIKRCISGCHSRRQCGGEMAAGGKSEDSHAGGVHRRTTALAADLQHRHFGVLKRCRMAVRRNPVPEHIGVDPQGGKPLGYRLSLRGQPGGRSLRPEEPGRQGGARRRGRGQLSGMAGTVRRPSRCCAAASPVRSPETVPRHRLRQRCPRRCGWRSCRCPRGEGARWTSAGRKSRSVSMSSKPAMVASRGMRSPSLRRAAAAPMAMTSLTAASSGRPPRTVVRVSFARFALRAVSGG